MRSLINAKSLLRNIGPRVRANRSISRGPAIADNRVVSQGEVLKTHTSWNFHLLPLSL